MIKKVIFYQTKDGIEPVAHWLQSIKQPSTRRRILQRLFRVEQGNYGDYRSIGSGVYELRFFFGSGYRIYFGEDGDSIVVLLVAGDKSSQRKDIKKSIIYWKEYQSDK